MKNKFSSLLFIIPILIIGCKSAIQKSAIAPPFSSFELPFIENEIDPSTDNKLTFEDGTLISIPANSLVNSEDEIIIERVIIKFKSYHTATEIMASGIPMSYDSAGIKNNFESAGMFDIDAKTISDKKVFINKKAKINVSLASFNKGDKFNFYKLNKKNGQWSFLGKNEAKKNDNKFLKIQEFKDDNLIQLDLNYNEYPRLKSLENINWIYCGNDANLDPIKNDWILNEKWRKLELVIKDEQNKIYHLNLKSKGKNISIPVTPYLMSDSINKLQDINTQIIAQNEYQELKKKEEVRLQLEADITRNFQIADFGIYNWDKIMRLVEEEEIWATNANFKVDGQPLEEKSKIYLLVGDQQRMIMKDVISWDSLIFKHNEQNALLILLPNNQIATCNSLEFQKAKGQLNHVFQTKKSNKIIASFNDISNTIQNLYK